MIKCNKGVVAISGEAGTILTELAGMIEAIHEKLIEVYGEKAADGMIAMAGRVAFMGDDAIEEEIERLDELLKGVKG